MKIEISDELIEEIRGLRGKNWKEVSAKDGCLQDFVESVLWESILWQKCNYVIEDLREKFIDNCHKY